MKNLYKKISSIEKAISFKFIFATVFLFSSLYTKAADGKLANPISATSIPDFLKSILTAATEIGAIIGALSIMYGGYLYATAQGDEEKLKKAKATVTWALVGTAVLIGATVIITAVTTTVGGVIN
ncbi:MAG: hypothetical protein WCV55_02485 [Candidatus Paceibacterota bacterium]